MSLLRGEYNSDDPWDWLGKGVKSSLREAGVREAATLLAAHLVDAGSAGTREDRELLARAVFDPGAVIFAASNGLTINLVAYGPWLPAETMGAARRIAAAAQHGGDPLRKFASDLTSKGAARIASVAGGAGFPASFEPAFPPVITLDGDPESLSTQLERAIPVIHDLLWHSEPELAFPPQPGGLRFTIVDDFYVREGQGGAGYVSDSWLEARSESGEPVLWESLGPYKVGDWYRVRHSVLAVAKVVEEEANRVAPGFVKSQGTIGIEVLPVSVWGSGKHKVRATFTEPGDEPRDLNVLGAGTARWVAAAVELACRRLEVGHQVVTAEAGVSLDEEAEKRRVVREARHAPLTQTAVRLQPSDAPARVAAASNAWSSAVRNGENPPAAR
jgi:hypothetical protein